LRVSASCSPSSNASIASVALFREPLGRPGLPGSKGRPRVCATYLRGCSVIALILDGKFGIGRNLVSQFGNHIAPVWEMLIETYRKQWNVWRRVGSCSPQKHLDPGGIWTGRHPRAGLMLGTSLKRRV
jgi:hypothetical protein